MNKKKLTPRILADSLLELSVKKPVDRITIKEIVQNCGLSSQTFYNHFENKKELILWIHKSFGEELMDDFERGEITFRQLTMRYLAFYAERADFMLNAMFNTTGLDSFWVNVSEHAIESFETFIRRKNRNKEISQMEKIHIRMFAYAITEIYAYWALHKMKIPKEELTEYIIAAMPQSLVKYLGEE